MDFANTRAWSMVTLCVLFGLQATENGLQTHKKARKTPERILATLSQGIVPSPLEDLARFEGPYQSSSKDKADKLRFDLSISTPLPKALCNIIASYFFYQLKKPITIHKEKSVEEIIKNPIAYTFLLAHRDESTIYGYEIINSFERISGIPQHLCTLQQWAYQRSDDHEERFCEGHEVTPLATYSITDFDRYTFGMDIDQNNEWAIRELLSKHPETVLEKPKSLRKRKLRSNCIIA